MLFTVALFAVAFCGSCSEDSAAVDEVVTPTYVVSFESNGGSSVTSQSVEEGGYATEPTDPTRENYIFDGWYSDSSLSAEWSFTTSITADITLYAKWVSTAGGLTDMETGSIW